MPNDATTWLVLVHVAPIPEDIDAHSFLAKVETLAEESFPDHGVDIAEVFAADVEVVSLEDLDNLPSTDD